jgi:hypothetical protein
MVDSGAVQAAVRSGFVRPEVAYFLASEHRMDPMAGEYCIPTPVRDVYGREQDPNTQYSGQWWGCGNVERQIASENALSRLESDPHRNFTAINGSTAPKDVSTDPYVRKQRRINLSIMERMERPQPANPMDITDVRGGATTEIANEFYRLARVARR